MKVTVFCLAYNHEKYIRKTLEGFVMQKTSFPFEVLIHDDASTDNTAAIIKEYEEKYPDIIKPIYQTENQYSKKIGITKNYIIPRAQGKYFAICEGDDYWCDPDKLQKQYDFLEANPDYSICVHSVNYNNISLGTVTKHPNISKDRDYTTDEIIRGDGGIFATNSVLIRREAYLNKPSVFLADGFGDYQLIMYASICGKCRCMQEPMSVYHYGVAGSWTQRTLSDKKKAISHYDAIINLLRNVDEYYNGKYHKAIKYKINEKTLQKLLLQKDYKAIIINPSYLRFFVKRLFIYLSNILKKYFPFLKKFKCFNKI